MTINSYDVGDLVRVSAAFTDDAGTATDPTTVSIAYKSPAGVTTTLVYGTDPEVVRDSAGHYHADIDVTESGTWRFRWFSSGPGQAAEESRFYVREQTVV